MRGARPRDQRATSAPASTRWASPSAARRRSRSRALGAAGVVVEVTGEGAGDGARGEDAPGRRGPCGAALDRVGAPQPGLHLELHQPHPARPRDGLVGRGRGRGRRRGARAAVAEPERLDDDARARSSPPTSRATRTTPPPRSSGGRRSRGPSRAASRAPCACEPSTRTSCPSCCVPGHRALHRDRARRCCPRPSRTPTPRSTAGGRRCWSRRCSRRPELLLARHRGPAAPGATARRPCRAALALVRRAAGARAGRPWSPGPGRPSWCSARADGRPGRSRSRAARRDASPDGGDAVGARAELPGGSASTGGRAERLGARSVSGTLGRCPAPSRVQPPTVIAGGPGVRVPRLDLRPARSRQLRVERAAAVARVRRPVSRTAVAHRARHVHGPRARHRLDRASHRRGGRILRDRHHRPPRRAVEPPPGPPARCLRDCGCPSCRRSPPSSGSPAPRRCARATCVEAIRPTSGSAGRTRARRPGPGSRRSESTEARRRRPARCPQPSRRRTSRSRSDASGAERPPRGRSRSRRTRQPRRAPAPQGRRCRAPVRGRRAQAARERAGGRPRQRAEDASRPPSARAGRRRGETRTERGDEPCGRPRRRRGGDRERASTDGARRPHGGADDRSERTTAVIGGQDSDARPRAAEAAAPTASATRRDRAAGRRSAEGQGDRQRADQEPRAGQRPGPPADTRPSGRPAPDDGRRRRGRAQPRRPPSRPRPLPRPRRRSARAHPVRRARRYDELEVSEDDVLAARRRHPRHPRQLRLRAHLRLPARPQRRLRLAGPGQEDGLRKGDAVTGAVRQPREGEQPQGQAAQQVQRAGAPRLGQRQDARAGAHARRLRRSSRRCTRRSACASRPSRNDAHAPASSTSSRRSARASAA